MRVRGRRPALEAKQFDGTETDARSILDFMNASGGERFIPARIHLPFSRHDVHCGDWVVKDDTGALYVMSDAEFRRRYEPVE